MAITISADHKTPPILYDLTKVERIGESSPFVLFIYLLLVFLAFPPIAIL